MNNWTIVGNLDDIPIDSGACVLVNHQQIAIFRIKDSQELYAVDNFDPISQANILSRGIIGDLKGELVIASPMYKQHFNLKTGQCLEKEDIAIKIWPVRVKENKVEVLVS